MKHESGEHEEAIKCYQKAIALNPTKASAFYNLALLYKSVKKYSDAIKSFHKAIELDPNYIEAYINMANVYKKVKKFK